VLELISIHQNLRKFMPTNRIKTIGYASGIAAEKPTCCMGPIILQEALKNKANLEWANTLYPQKSAAQLAAIDAVAAINQTLALNTYEWTLQHERFLVLGGDHTSGIGTWSGAASAVNGHMGLIWIDAHMDSHTPETSHSKNLHGMPLAVLLGHGDQRLTQLFDKKIKLLPNNVCLIGVRSFEDEEAKLLEQLGVRIYFIEEVLTRGFKTVFAEAQNIVTQNTAAYGISLDIDAIDPKDAPGTGASVAGGFLAESLLDAFQDLSSDKRLLGLEIAEFDPTLDQEHKTENIIIDLINTL
jgi:arginase